MGSSQGFRVLACSRNAPSFSPETQGCKGGDYDGQALYWKWKACESTASTQDKRCSVFQEPSLAETNINVGNIGESLPRYFRALDHFIGDRVGQPCSRLARPLSWCVFKRVSPSAFVAPDPFAHGVPEALWPLPTNRAFLRRPLVARMLHVASTPRLRVKV